MWEKSFFPDEIVPVFLAMHPADTFELCPKHKIINIIK